MENTPYAIAVGCTSYVESVREALNRIGAREILPRSGSILLKPNLVNASPFPVTTSPFFCEAVIEYIRSHSDAVLTIGEGCGDASCDTFEVFHALGYQELAERHGIRLVDLNTEKLTRVTNRKNRIFPEMYLPEIAFHHYIVSLPVLKAHSLASITGTLKNMMGFAPPKYYSGGDGAWNKSLFHRDMHQSIIELNRFITPDLSIMDASRGLSRFHLGGPECSPPVGKIIAGTHAVHVDRLAAGLLGLDYREVMHIR